MTEAHRTTMLSASVQATMHEMANSRNETTDKPIGGRLRPGPIGPLNSPVMNANGGRPVRSLCTTFAL